MVFVYLGHGEVQESRRADQGPQTIASFLLWWAVRCVHWGDYVIQDVPFPAAAFWQASPGLANLLRPPLILRGGTQIRLFTDCSPAGYSPSWLHIKKHSSSMYSCIWANYFIFLILLQTDLIVFTACQCENLHLFFINPWKTRKALTKPCDILMSMFPVYT